MAVRDVGSGTAEFLFDVRARLAKPAGISTLGIPKLIVFIIIISYQNSVERHDTRHQIISKIEYRVKNEMNHFYSNLWMEL